MSDVRHGTPRRAFPTDEPRPERYNRRVHGFPVRVPPCLSGSLAYGPCRRIAAGRRSPLGVGLGQRALGPLGPGGLRVRRIHDREAAARGRGLSPLDAAGGRGGEDCQPPRGADRATGGRDEPGGRMPAHRRRPGGDAHADEADPRDRPATIVWRWWRPACPTSSWAGPWPAPGYHFAPDPSSQVASTIGGNVATNAGGPHTLKYGVTVNHVLGLEVVLGDGSILRLGPVENPAGLDLIGVLVGSEGTLAIVTKVWVRLTPDPQDYRTLRAIFSTVDDATNAISEIIAAGIDSGGDGADGPGDRGGGRSGLPFRLPAGRRGDRGHRSSTARRPGSTRNAAGRRKSASGGGAREVLRAATAPERELLWKCRKMAVGAVGRLSPSYCIQDGVVPRTRLPHVLRRIARDRREAPRADRQRGPCRRRQRASDPAVRRARPGRRWPACWRRAARSWKSASPAAAASPASTASAWRRSVLHAPAVRPRRPGGHAPRPPGLQSLRPALAGQTAARRACNKIIHRADAARSVSRGG